MSLYKYITIIKIIIRVSSLFYSAIIYCVRFSKDVGTNGVHLPITNK